MGTWKLTCWNPSFTNINVFTYFNFKPFVLTPIVFLIRKLSKRLSGSRFFCGFPKFNLLIFQIYCFYLNKFDIFCIFYHWIYKFLVFCFWNLISILKVPFLYRNCLVVSETGWKSLHLTLYVFVYLHSLSFWSPVCGWKGPMSYHLFVCPSALPSFCPEVFLGLAH